MKDVWKIPDGWEWTTVGEITDVKGGITLNQSRDVVDPVSVPYLRVANVQRGRLDLTNIKTVEIPRDRLEDYTLEPGDILFNEGGDRDKLGRGWVWNGEIKGCCHQNHVFRARPVVTVVDSKFVSYWGNEFGRAYFEREGKQTTNLASINRAKLRALPVPLPPLAEQRRIVARIEELFSRLDAGVAALRHAKAQLQRYRQSVLAAAVTGQLTQAWREQHLDTEPAEASVMAEGAGGMSAFLNRWKVAKIADFAKTTSGGTPSRKKPEFYTGDIPWIKSGDLNDGIVSEATEFITADGLKSSSAKMFPAGTLMIALYGATIGKLGVLTIDAATNQAVCGIFVPEKVETKYLFYFLLHHRRELIKLGAGGAQPNISQGIIRDVEVPLPPLLEQRQIVAEIDARFTTVDHLQEELEKQLKRTQTLRQTILSAGFCGQLVPQGPDDEPSEILLERIEAKKKQPISTGKAQPTPQPARSKKMKKDDQLVSLDELKQDFLASLMEELNKNTISPDTLWKASGLSIDLFYAALKREIESGSVRETEDRKLELAS